MDAALAFKGKRVDELTPNQKALVAFLFPDVKPDSVIGCDLCADNEKPDFFLEIGGERHFISLKGGRTDEIHVENIKSLVLYLRALGVSKETQKTILLYHYGDGTMDGTGKQRWSARQLAIDFRQRLDAANIELNAKPILRACLKRFLFVGADTSRNHADVIAYGDPTYFIYASRDEVFDVVMRKDYQHIQTLHIGPMIVRPWIRNLSRRQESEWKRCYAQVRYANLMGDIQRIAERRKK